jgi:hypothetical protein
MAHANTQSNDAHGDHPLVGHLVPMWLLMLIGTTLLVLYRREARARRLAPPPNDFSRQGVAPTA